MYVEKQHSIKDLIDLITGAEKGDAIVCDFQLLFLMLQDS